jgi:hypothetical protein
LGYQAEETVNEDSLDQHHQSEEKPLAGAGEGNGANEYQRGSQGERIEGESEGDPGTPHARAEAKPVGLPAGVTWHSIRSCRFEAVELVPQVPELVLFAHSSIIPRCTAKTPSAAGKVLGGKDPLLGRCLKGRTGTQ